MKYSIAALAAFILSAAVHAQTRIAVKGGYNYSTARAYFNSVKQGTGYKSGFAIGAMCKAEFEGALHFSPSVMLNQRGYIINPTAGAIKKYDNSITYLDIYPAFSLDFKLGSDEKVFAVDFGPQFSLAAFGKEKTTDAVSGLTTKSKMIFKITGGYGLLDVGVNGGVGLHLNKFLVEARYFHGLVSINNEEEFDQRNIRNRMISLNIGYYLK